MAIRSRMSEAMTSMEFALILMFCIPVVTWYIAVWLTDYFDGKK